MSIFLFILSFAAGVGVLTSFVIGTAGYFSGSGYKKWWQVSLVLFGVTSIFTLLATFTDPDMGLNAGLLFLWVYISLLMFGIILVYIIKRVRKDETAGYKKRIAVTFVAGFVLFFIVVATMDPPENDVREDEEAVAIGEVTEEKPEEDSASDEKKELGAEQEEPDREKAELEAEQKKLEEEKSTEQARLKGEKEEKTAEEKSIEEQEEEETEKESVSETEEAYEPGSEDRIPVTVASFTDGDTTRFMYNGNNEPFRYLLIDTPETNHPRLGEQPFGKEASARTRELLGNADVIEVEFDVGAKQDHYQRNLAYIYADGRMVNEILVREGLAQVNYIEPPNTRHLERLETAQALAQQEHIGIWSLPHPFDSDIYQEESGSQENADVRKPGDTETGGSTGTPAQGGSEHFQNCAELREVYPDGVPAGHAAYQPKMDRDKDDYACE